MSLIGDAYKSHGYSTNKIHTEDYIDNCYMLTDDWVGMDKPTGHAILFKSMDEVRSTRIAGMGGGIVEVSIMVRKIIQDPDTAVWPADKKSNN